MSVIREGWTRTLHLCVLLLLCVCMFVPTQLHVCASSRINMFFYDCANEFLWTWCQRVRKEERRTRCKLLLRQMCAAVVCLLRDYLPVNGPKPRNGGMNEGEEEIDPSPGELRLSGSSGRYRATGHMQEQAGRGECSRRQDGDTEASPRRPTPPDLLQEDGSGGQGHRHQDRQQHHVLCDITPSYRLSSSFFFFLTTTTAAAAFAAGVLP